MKTEIKTHSYPVVDSEVATAYADVTHKDFGAALKIRNLNFKASAFVTRDEAKSILAKWVPSYNEFKPKLLDKFPSDCKVLICREYSVGLYVTGEKLPSADSVFADYRREAEVYGEKVTHYWWD